MKRAVVASILVLVLTVTMVAPTFAGDPPDNKPGSWNNPGLWNAYFKIPGNGYSYFAKAVVDYILMVGTPPNWWK